MMLFFKPKKRDHEMNRAIEVSAGMGVGSIAGFLGGLLGVGGGNFIVPVLNWLGLDAKVAAGTTALVVVFSSFSGFLGHANVGAGAEGERIRVVRRVVVRAPCHVLARCHDSHARWNAHGRSVEAIACWK
jgi:uncharacterized membrane protein YfcA